MDYFKPEMLMYYMYLLVVNVFDRELFLQYLYIVNHKCLIFEFVSHTLRLAIIFSIFLLDLFSVYNHSFRPPFFCL